MSGGSNARSRYAWMVLGLFLALGLSGCLRGDDGGDDGNATGDGGDGMGTDALAFRSHPTLGEILVDPDGMTLYVFTSDDPGVSNCSGECAVNWPPYAVDAVPGAPELIAGDLSLVERGDGSTMLAYQERPLYYFIGDEAAGDAAGDGRGGVWFVVKRPPANSEMLSDAGPHEVKALEVAYHGDVTGFYAAPQASEGVAGMGGSGGEGAPSTTGVVMIHEWWGLNGNIQDMAELLASHGYRVLAVDLFDGNVATTSQEAQAQVQGLDQEEANANMQAAAQYLRDQGAEQVVSLGWCFGGGQSLQLAMSGEALAGTIIYYGFLTSDEDRLAAIQWPVLGIFGEEDQAVSVDSVRQFEAALENLSIENQILIYPDVGHAFANPSGDAWAPEATADAWGRTLGFLEEVGWA